MPTFEGLKYVKDSNHVTHINMLNRGKAEITHEHNVELKNGLKLKNTLCVPSFNFKLLSVSKLVKDNDCMVTFYPKCCVMQDLHARIVKEVGREQVACTIFVMLVFKNNGLLLKMCMIVSQDFLRNIKIK